MACVFSSHLLQAHGHLCTARVNGVTGVPLKPDQLLTVTPCDFRAAAHGPDSEVVILLFILILFIHVSGSIPKR